MKDPAAARGPLVAAAPPVAARLIFHRFWPYARPVRRWIGPALALVVAGPAIEAAQIWMLKLLVDEVLVPRDFGPFGPLALAAVGLGLLGGAVSFSDTYLSNWMAQRFLLELRTSFFSHLQTLSLDFFERRRLGDLLARLTDDIGAIESLVISGIVDAFAYATRIVYFVGVLLYLQLDLAVVSLAAAPLFWFAARRFAGRIKQASREKRRLSGSLTAVAEESFANAALVQAYNQQATELEHFRRQCLGVFQAQMVAARLRGLYAPLVDLAQLAGVLAVVGVGTWELANQRMTLGALLAFVAYLSQLYSPVRGLSRLGGSLFAAVAAAERIIEFLNQRPAVPELARPFRLDVVRGHLRLEHVSFSYPGSPRPALREVSFEVRPGQIVALVGASGAGKSTVAKLLLRFYDPSSGRILLDGYDLRALSLRELRDRMALLLQETLIFDGSVRDNIAYGRPGASDAQIVDAARRADAHEFIADLPDGYATLVGQRGRRLSGGQRQRIAIARAMLRDAPILVLDEPTTGLDAESGFRVLEPLRRLMSGRTTIIISHNLATVREASEILVFEAGGLVESGTHVELMLRDGVYTRLYRFHQGQAELVGTC